MEFGLASSTFGQEEKDAILRIIESDRFTMGENVSAFEAAFANYFGSRYAVMVNSGSSANLIAVAALRYRKDKPLMPGDEVIVPCISWATTFYPLLQYGFKLKFVDVNLQTLNYDLEALEKSVSDKTRMIVAVSILGNPCDFDVIRNICDHHELILFEDNCESMGARFGGKYAGTFGLVGTFSTFFSHHISTMEGGLILTDNHEIYCLARSLRNHGWTRDQDPDSPLFIRKENDFFEAYRFILPGYNVRPTEMQGAIGLEQLKKLDTFLAARRMNALYFVDRFGSDERFIIQHETGESAWFSFTMIVNPAIGIGRPRVLEALKKAGIEHRIITGGNFLRHEVIKYFDYTVSGSVNADTAHDHGFFVGNHPFDVRDKIDYLYHTLQSI